ncbi:predicted protein [Verticillium alfalfae VaMs.102]|uniref:Predicted protein n=1 Tax=Verticillium alfalfae (strain VaMs.102 / ATCC MYA-4576 / FGSC 10136) TaxID=526221 RepID=C9SBF9_VERA1|nr:predicted protein [Verticillium alfalfae VaMs.102]EEY15693.1 predicted protein [Verticillium alfalfae VaMs.102]
MHGASDGQHRSARLLVQTLVNGPAQKARAVQLRRHGQSTVRHTYQRFGHEGYCLMTIVFIAEDFHTISPLMRKRKPTIIHVVNQLARAEVHAASSSSQALIAAHKISNPWRIESPGHEL